MLRGKDRSYLKSLANNLKPLAQIGKSGISDGLINQLDKLLEDHELVKINVLQNSPDEAKNMTEEILNRTGAEFVQQIGSKITIYRESKENKQIEFDRNWYGKNWNYGWYF